MIRRRLAARALAALVLLFPLNPATPAAALSCVFYPFQRPGERFGSKELVAHVEVLDVQPDGVMDVRILRVLHGTEHRPIVAVDAARALGWNMPQQWGFEPFTRGTQWTIVMLPGFDGRAPWQPQLCRAYLKVDGGSAEGFVTDLTRRERLPIEGLAERVAPLQPPAAPTRSR